MTTEDPTIMTQPIGSTPRGLFDDPGAFPHDAESAGTPRLPVCRAPDTVLEGFICQDRAAVSRACRTPKNRVDAFICDEPRMKRLQDSIVEETLGALKSILLTLLMRQAPK
jgi:hypothetical protein